ncbi:MAG TPA: enoyl-CoA hydratase-related protein [Anaerolineales bacterium]
MAFQTILTSIRDKAGVITLNRPEARNALNNQLVHELMDALEAFDRDAAVGAVVLTGNEKAFAAGADIKEMAGRNPAEMKASGFIDAFARMNAIRKPLVAAVSGWALGGGCELALACDMVVASDTARFGQPEVTIGVIPGAGGTQRLTRRIGKALAMEIVLNNRILTAPEALQFGIVNRVVPAEHCLEEALKLANEIARRAPLAVQTAKRMVNQAQESRLTDGLQAEREAFFDLFGTSDRIEGMRAFVEKRDPRWTGS